MFLAQFFPQNMQNSLRTLLDILEQPKKQKLVCHEKVGAYL